MLQPYNQSHNTFLNVCVGYHSFHLNSQSSAALSLCPGHHTHTRPPLILLGRCKILWWNPTSYTLCRLIAIVFPTDSRGDAIFSFVLLNAVHCTLPHSGGGRQQILADPRNRAARTVQISPPQMSQILGSLLLPSLLKPVWCMSLLWTKLLDSW